MEFIKEGDTWKRQTYDGKSPHDGVPPEQSMQ
jgi:hypothetical protein